jgi:GNAT superfamily N-acetyltransferase
VTPATDGITIRRAVPGDRPAILDLARRALGWAGDERDRAFFAWKHDDNPFGPSPAWVADEDGAVVGFRTFLRWAWRSPDGTQVPAVRAVDTATDPACAGRGIFTRLTTHALADLEAEGVGFVFNTPNDKSRPGYLKMGWTVAGRPAVVARPRSIGALARMTGARTAAEKWSEEAPGRPALEALGDDRALEGLLARTTTAGWTTCRTPTYLRWRYGFAALAYRAAALGPDGADGVALYRVRCRGRAVEATVGELLVPEGDRAAARVLVAAVGRASGADYVLRTSDGARSGREIPLPGAGPIVTTRKVNGDPPDLASWRLTLGDLELF